MKIHELTDDQLKSLLECEISKALVLKRQNMSDIEAAIHIDFLLSYARRSCGQWDEVGLKDFFIKYLSGDLTKIYAINATDIIEGIKLYRQNMRVVGTPKKYNIEEYIRSNEHKDKVKKILESGRHISEISADELKDVYMSYEEQIQIDPEMHERRELAKKQKTNLENKHKSFRK